MKRAALILFTCVTFSCFCQTGPPTIRCLEVLQNGNVLLHITPANDPGNDFSHYEVLTSIAKSGPFGVAIPSVTPIGTQSITHTSTLALAQPIYYIIRSVEKDNDVSANSDTVRSMFLNIYPKDPALELVYGGTRNPPLPGTGQFTITRAEPPSPPVTLTVTSAQKHYDVISQCKVSLTYQVLQNDNGCISRSNIISGQYYDTKYPDAAIIDSISVLPDGRTIISWNKSPDLDVDTYSVIKRLPDRNSFLAKVPGHDSTTFIFEDTEALNNPVRLYIMPVDSCGKQAVFDERPVTMHLRAGYDQCRYRSKLLWNGYKGMKNGVREYKVYCSINNGPFTVVAVTQDTTFTHDSVPPESQVTYFVRVVNGDRSITASSNRTTFFSRQVPVPGLNFLRQASVLRKNDVELLIVVDESATFTALDVERSRDPAEGFVNAGSLTYRPGNQFYFVDEGAEPSARPYYYRVILRDSCGNARGVSNVCKTVHLTASSSENDFRQTLSWTPYEGFRTGVQEYRIYRVVNGDAQPPLLATTNSNITTYTDDISEVAGQGSDIAYVVQAIENSGLPLSLDGRAFSNLVPVYMEGRMFVPNAFSPNGLNRTWKPVTHFIDHTDYSVRVFNRWGKEVFASSDNQASWDGNNCTPDVYVYLISYRNSRGEYREQKGTVLLLK